MNKDTISRESLRQKLGKYLFLHDGSDPMDILRIIEQEPAVEDGREPAETETKGEMQKRLESLINASGILCDDCGESDSSYCAEALADYLLDSNVVILPCNIGDDLWWIDEETNTAQCDPGAVAGFVYTEDGFLIRTKDGDTEPIGSTYCFLSQGDAEAEIQRRKGARAREVEEARCRRILEAYFARCGGAKDELDRLRLLSEAVEKYERMTRFTVRHTGCCEEE